MEKIEQALWSDYDYIDGKLKQIDAGQEGFAEALKEKDAIRGELIDLEKLKKDDNARIVELQVDTKKEYIRNAISLLTFGVTTITGILVVNKTFKFDTESTVTSTLGRGILSNAASKIFKR